jgi:hypothetical protein
MSSEFTEVMNVKVRAGSKTYYIAVGQHADGSRFVSLSEVRGGAEGERSRILIDEAYVTELHRALGTVAAFLEGKPRRTSAQPVTLAERRQAHPRAYEPWTDEEEKRLREGHAQGHSVGELARQLQRKPSAVRSRLRRLNAAMPEKPR